MIVVSDTTAITYLLAIQRAHLLRDLFGVVVVPEQVRSELSVAHEALPDFVQTRAVRDLEKVRRLQAVRLDRGEAEAIALAEELAADYLLIDEKMGRRVAEQRGLKIVGVLGVLAQAKERGLISQVGPELEALIDRAGLWVAPDLRTRFLRDLGEA